MLLRCLHCSPLVAALGLLVVAPACVTDDSAEGPAGPPELAHPGVQVLAGNPALPSQPLGLSCQAIDGELSLNCDIDTPCSTFSTAEAQCIDDVMSIDWSRPPCEEYAECLGMPLFSCADTDGELINNCDIADHPCAQMTWAERWCLSDIMAVDWFAPPCDLYTACLN